MGLEDIRRRETIDLAERARELREDLIPAVEGRIDEAAQADEDDEADDPKYPPEEYRDLRDRLEGQADACERVVDALDGDGAFTIQELMAAETSMLQDDVAEQSLDVDFERQRMDGTPKEGYHRIRTLEVSVVDAPAAMDTRHDPDLGREVYQVGLLPDHVAQYLYECVTALNDAGEVDDVGNLSDYGVPSDGV